MQRFLFNIDRVSAWSGKTVSWVILLSTFLISYDILMRYLSKPFLDFIRPIWFTYDYSYDMSYYLYAVLFMIGGAYTLSRAQHVRGDIFYRMWPVKVQAGVDLFLYFFALGTKWYRFEPDRVHVVERTASGWTTPTPVSAPGVVVWRVVGHRRALLHDRRRAADLPAQGRDPARRGAARGPGDRRGHSLLAGATDRGLAGAPERRRGDRDHPREAERAMSPEVLGLLMITLMVVAIMIGFPTAFTLMSLGVTFGFLGMGFRVFDLIVFRTFFVMQNEVLVAIPLFLFMGYVIERAGIPKK